MAATLLRIAHAYGNRRERIVRACAAGVDLIEADLRWWRGAIWIRHEHRWSRGPILYNHRLRGIHRAGPWALPAGSWWLRLDVGSMSFGELLRRVTGGTGLLIDLKSDTYAREEAGRFVSAVIAELERSGFQGQVDFCGSWQYLDLVRAARPTQSVHYSVDSATNWGAVESRLGSAQMLPKITLKRSLLNEERAALLRAAGVTFIVWDIATPADAEFAIALGAEGLIADDLELLRSLAGRAAVDRGTGK